jgi:hypothetical protein
MWHPGPPQSREVLDQVMAEHHEKLMADLRLLVDLARRQRDEARWKLLLAENEINRLRARIADLEEEALLCASGAHELDIDSN